MVQETFVLTGGIETTEYALIDNNISHWFGIIDEDGLTFQSQITDNYIENNTAIQDHIAQSPVTITLSGYVGETVYYPPKTFLQNTIDFTNDYTSNKLGFTVGDKLTPITALLPPVSNVTQAARNVVQYAESSYRRYEKIFNQFKSLNKKQQKSPTQTSQEYTANKLKALWEARKMVEVITPWGKYEDMQIVSINLRQGNTTSTTNLSVTLKQINYASTYTTEPNLEVMAMYNAVQRTDEANHGKAQGIGVNDSVIGDIIYRYNPDAKFKFGNL